MSDNLLRQEKDHLSLSRRILTSILLTSIVIAIAYSAIILLFLKANDQALTVSLIAIPVISTLYFFSKNEKAFKYVVSAFTFSSLLFLAIAWVFTGGVFGGTGYFYIALVAFFVLINPIKYRFPIIGLTALCVIAIYSFEQYCPTCIHQDMSVEKQSFALLINIILTILIVSWALVTAKKEYEDEHTITKEQNKALVNAHAAKSRFLANVSHEIRTPMNGVIGMASLLEKTTLSAEQKEYVETIMVSSDRLLGIINQILDFSKADAGKTELILQPFSLQQSIRDAIQINAPHALKKQLELNYTLEDNLPDGLMGDSEKLQQILINLIGNAIKFTSSGGIYLHVTRQSSSDQRIKLLFELKDTGIGIPNANIPYLFDAFTQVDDSRTRKYSGTGLGLAISKRLVELMGGEIWVESEQGQGSSFFFTIKMEALPSNSKIPIKNKDLIVNPFSIVSEALEILIVEDDKINRLLAMRLFEKLGHHPDAVVNGQEALDALQNKTYNLVFMDIQMPVMDGLEATEIIRETHQHQPIIIAMTANAMPEDRLLCEIAGMDDFLAKPVKLDILEKMLLKWQNAI